MRDITDLMNTYRECCRNLWNVYFSEKTNIGASLDAFGQIEKLLFEGLIVNDLFYDGDAMVEDLPSPVLMVVPRERAPILIESLSLPGQATYWGEVKDMVVSPGEIELQFVEYFDFNRAPLTDLRYYLCEIQRFARHSEFEGRRALIEALNGRVFHDESK